MADVNVDGWLDVVSISTNSLADPKHIGHPRVYINLGDDEAGQWRGLQFDNDRIPQMLSNPTCKGCKPHPPAGHH